MEIVLSVDPLLSATFLGLLGGSVCVGQTTWVIKEGTSKKLKIH